MIHLSISFAELEACEMKNGAELHLCYRFQLVKVVSFSIAQVTAIVVHGIGDRPRSLEDLCRRKSLFMERLMITAACRRKANFEFRTIQRRDVATSCATSGVPIKSGKPSCIGSPGLRYASMSA